MWSPVSGTEHAKDRKKGSSSSGSAKKEKKEKKPKSMTKGFLEKGLGLSDDEDARDDIDRSRPLCMLEGETEADIGPFTNITDKWLAKALREYWGACEQLNAGSAHDLYTYLHQLGMSSGSFSSHMVGFRLTYPFLASPFIFCYCTDSSHLRRLSQSLGANLRDQTGARAVR